MRFTALIASTLAATAAAQFSQDPNEPCGMQPLGFAPPTPGSAENFARNPGYGAIAFSAPTPSGWTRSFANLKAATSGSNYMGFATLQSYNTTACASRCKAMSGCVGFNNHVERTPFVNPAPACQDPPSTATYKCSFWGAPVTAENATNAGQYREQFHVLIAASNGYNLA